MAPMTPLLFWKGYDGAFIYWALKGFKGKYQDELKPEKKKRNVITSFVFWITLILLLNKYL